MTHSYLDDPRFSYRVSGFAVFAGITKDAMAVLAKLSVFGFTAHAELEGRDRVGELYLPASLTRSKPATGWVCLSTYCLALCL